MVERFLCFGDDLESDSEDHVPETAPIFTNERTANATASAGTSNNTNDNVTTSGISTAQGDVDALTTALDVASRSAQRLIPQLTQLSERVRSRIFSKALQARPRLRKDEITTNNLS